MRDIIGKSTSKPLTNSFLSVKILSGKGGIMKKFFSEFKTFITRGNVIDMSVGVVVGGAFTAIVNGLTNFILKPLINWILALIFRTNDLSQLYTLLKAYYIEDAAAGTKVLDLATSIYIDWGSFISAIINFLLTAFVLFLIVKLINKFREESHELAEKLKKKKISKEDRAALKARGIKLRDKEAVAAYFAEKEAIAEAEKLAAEEEAKRAEEEKKAEDAKLTTDDLLRQIRDALVK